jgi:hypothetical protein
LEFDLQEEDEDSLIEDNGPDAIPPGAGFEGRERKARETNTSIVRQPRRAARETEECEATTMAFEASLHNEIMRDSAIER